MINPATEEVIEQIPFGDVTDARIALDAAHEAFDDWSHTNPYQRARFLETAAELLRKSGQASLPRSLPRSRASRSSRPKANGRHVRTTSYGRPRKAKRIYGRFDSGAGRRQADRRLLSPGRSGRADHRLELPGLQPGPGDQLGVGGRLHGRLPPERVHPSLGDADRQLPRGGRDSRQGCSTSSTASRVSIGQEFLDDPRCRKISFTGSTRVGKLLMDGASRTVTRLALEMGGNAPVIIFPDAGEPAAIAAGRGHHQGPQRRPGLRRSPALLCP